MAIGTPQIGLKSSNYRDLAFTAAQAARFNAGDWARSGPRCTKRARWLRFRPCRDAYPALDPPEWVIWKSEGPLGHLFEVAMHDRDRDTKVIGYFALRPPVDVVCVEVDACLIIDSEKAMLAHAEKVFAGDIRNVTIKRTRFGEILHGLRLGGGYAFDALSYSRFYPLALEAGLPVEKADFTERQKDGEAFFTVRLASK
jgi:hypothetical protein